MNAFTHMPVVDIVAMVVVTMIIVATVIVISTRTNRS